MAAVAESAGWEVGFEGWARDAWGSRAAAAAPARRLKRNIFVCPFMSAASSTGCPRLRGAMEWRPGSPGRCGQAAWCVVCEVREGAFKALRF